jgi:hypothetical protein
MRAQRVVTRQYAHTLWSDQAESLCGRMPFARIPKFRAVPVIDHTILPLGYSPRCVPSNFVLRLYVRLLRPGQPMSTQSRWVRCLGERFAVQRSDLSKQEMSTVSSGSRNEIFYWLGALLGPWSHCQPAPDVLNERQQLVRPGWMWTSLTATGARKMHPQS